MKKAIIIIFGLLLISLIILFSGCVTLNQEQVETIFKNKQKAQMLEDRGHGHEAERVRNKKPIHGNTVFLWEIWEEATDLDPFYFPEYHRRTKKVNYEPTGDTTLGLFLVSPTLYFLSYSYLKSSILAYKLVENPDYLLPYEKNFNINSLLLMNRKPLKNGTTNQIR